MLNVAEQGALWQARPHPDAGEWRDIGWMISEPLLPSAHPAETLKMIKRIRDHTPTSRALLASGVIS